MAKKLYHASSTTYPDSAGWPRLMTDCNRQCLPCRPEFEMGRGWYQDVALAHMARHYRTFSKVPRVCHFVCSVVHNPETRRGLERA